jgi:hypothetical protein
LPPKPGAAPPVNPLYAALMQQMGAAKTPEDLDDVAADLAMATFTEREMGVLNRALSRRRQQLTEETARAQDDDNIPF